MVTALIPEQLETHTRYLRGNDSHSIVLDDPNLQDEVLHFVNAVLIHDHPRLCKPLRNSVLAVKGVIQRKNLKLFRDQAPPVKVAYWQLVPQGVSLNESCTVRIIYMC